MDDKTNLIKPVLIFNIIIFACVVAILGLQIFQTVKINSLSGESETATSTEQYVQVGDQQPAAQQPIMQQPQAQQPVKSGAATGTQSVLTPTQQSCLKTCMGGGKTIQTCATECNLPVKQ